jgi:hypothetical protein
MAGRPRVMIDWEKVNDYARAHASGRSIARLIGIHPNTLEKAIKREYHMGYTEFMEERKEEGRTMVKKVIYDAVIGGNALLAIWWSKNCMGWSDKQSIDHSGLAPILQINVGNEDPQKIKQIENFFNGKTVDACIRKELRGISEGIEADNQ